MFEVSWFVFWCTQLLLASTVYYPCFAILWLFDGIFRGRFWSKYNAPQPGQAILVTGCDTGFGHDLALELVAKGWRVYAGCLTEEGRASLKERAGPAGGELLVALRFDVTKQEDIDEAVGRIKADGAHLYAVVNNAGIGRGSLIHWSPMSGGSWLGRQRRWRLRTALIHPPTHLTQQQSTDKSWNATSSRSWPFARPPSPCCARRGAYLVHGWLLLLLLDGTLGQSLSYISI